MVALCAWTPSSTAPRTWCARPRSWASSPTRRRRPWRLLADGVHQLTSAFERLSQHRHGDGDETATAAADAAVKTQRQVERVYRKAASALLTVDDLREVTGRRELYRRFSRVRETRIEAADRVWYATSRRVDRHANRGRHDQPGGHRRDAKGPR
jgi:hypothetical protein